MQQVSKEQFHKLGELIGRDRLRALVYLNEPDIIDVPVPAPAPAAPQPAPGKLEVILACMARVSPVMTCVHGVIVWRHQQAKALVDGYRHQKQRASHHMVSVHRPVRGWRTVST